MTDAVRRPVPVTVAGWFLVVGAVLGLLGLLALLFFADFEGKLLVGALGLPALFLQLLIGLDVLAGQSWARITVPILYGLSLVAAVVQGEGLRAVIVAVVGVALTACLFGRDASAWFAAPDNFGKSAVVRLAPKSAVWVLMMKELRQIFLSPIAYAFLIVFVFFVTFMFFRVFFLVRETTMSGFFDFFPIAFAVVIPGVTMRMWAEERRQGTIEFLLTSPIETWHIVLGKFFAGLILVALCVLMTLMVPYTVSRFGELDPGPVIGGYLGAVLMGGTCIAIGMFLSAFTADQIVSFLAGVVVLLSLVLLGHPFIASEFGAGSWLGAFARVVSPTTHFESIGRGVVDLRDIYYFAGMTALFLYLNARVIDLRRWR